MGFIVGAAETIEAAGKHVRNTHTCTKCGMVCRGNGYFRHERACQRIQVGEFGVRCAPKEKTCRTCLTTKPIGSFLKHKCNADGHFSDCRDCVNAYKRRTAKRYPWSCNSQNPKFRARQKLRAAIKAGIIARPPACPQCGAEGMVEAHHENYDEPYSVLWLCKSCHVAHHRKQVAA